VRASWADRARRRRPSISVFKILFVETIMLANLLAFAALSAAVLFAAPVQPAAEAGVKDCCAKKLACCDKGSACCKASVKEGCCAQGKDCCQQVKSCCTGAQPCCKAGAACCARAEDCCGTLTREAVKSCCAGKCCAR
jgi:hypothetical protein